MNGGGVTGYMETDEEKLERWGDLSDDEVVVRLADGWTLRSGSLTDEFVCGEYVRLVRPDESEYLYWSWDEWCEDPALVMGAIMNAASGFRPQDLGPNP